jgi:hypothetical protein
MSALLRFSLLALTFLGPALLIVQVELGEAHWRDCFERMADRAAGLGDRSYPPIETWAIALNALLRPAKEALMLVAGPMLPAFAAIVLARRPWAALVALAPMLVAVLLSLGDPSTMHDCDRKGCNGCVGIVLFLLLFQLPIGTVVLIGLGLDRLRSHRHARSTQ